MSKKLTQVIVTLLVLVTLTAGAAQAAPWSLDRPEPSPFAALWEWIGSWFEPAEPAAVWMEGCGMDPDGRCHSGLTTGGDPNGLVTGDEGCSMDPNGC